MDAGFPSRKAEIVAPVPLDMKNHEHHWVRVPQLDASSLDRYRCSDLECGAFAYRQWPRVKDLSQRGPVPPIKIHAEYMQRKLQKQLDGPRVTVHERGLGRGPSQDTQDWREPPREKD